MPNSNDLTKNHNTIIYIINTEPTCDAYLSKSELLIQYDIFWFHEFTCKVLYSIFPLQLNSIP